MGSLNNLKIFINYIFNNYKFLILLDSLKFIIDYLLFISFYVGFYFDKRTKNKICNKFIP